MPLQTLPSEIILSIAENLDYDGDINRLSKTCRRMHMIVGDHLYRDNIRSRRGSALFWAALHGNDRTAEILFETKAMMHPEAQQSLDETFPDGDPSAEFGYVRQIVQWSNLTQGHIFTRQDRPTLLSFAAEQGHEKMIRLLVRNGANVNEPNADRMTPLSWAASKGHRAAVVALVNSGADVNPGMPMSCRTPLSFAAGSGDEAVVEFLLQRGAKVEPNFEEGVSSLWFAIEGGHESMVGLMTYNGTGVNPMPHSLYTPLITAAWLGHSGIARMLVQRGADLNAQTSTGWTPLMFAADAGQLAVVKILIDNGADINHCALDGTTALELAACNGHTEIANLLIQDGADVRGYHSSRFQGGSGYWPWGYRAVDTVV